MGKFRDRRKKKNEKKRLRKFGLDPNGETFSRKTYKQFKKYGWDDEHNRLRGKGEHKRLHSNKANRRARTAMREEVRYIRAETGNTFMNGFKDLFGSVLGFFGL